MKRFTLAFLILCSIANLGCETSNPICSDNFCVTGEIFAKSDLEEGQDFDNAPATISEQEFLNLLSNGNIQPINTNISEEQVYDGDTITDVQILICKTCDLETPFPGMIVEGDNIYREVNIRINGIDTPEMQPRKADHETEALRLREKKLAELARDYLRSLIKNATDIQIRNLQPDKYYGRIVADVLIKDKDEYYNVAERMIKCGFAIAYDSGTKEKGYWGTAPAPTCAVNY